MKSNRFPRAAGYAASLICACSLAARAADGTAPDIAKLQVAANKGDAESQFLLGRAYYRGEGVSQNYAKALDLYRAAATQGNLKAENNLASMYSNGQGTRPDRVEAAKWYRKAAEQGAALAEYNLATILEEGADADKNVPEAAQWLEKAGNQGIYAAQAALGRGSRGIPPSPPNGSPRPPRRATTKPSFFWANYTRMVWACIKTSRRPSIFSPNQPIRVILRRSAAWARFTARAPASKSNR